MANCNEYHTFMRDQISLEQRRERLVRDLLKLHEEWNNAMDYDEDDEEIVIIMDDMDYVRAQIREVDALLAS